ncbi:tRNA dihydrouridine synthase DusB [Schaalia sp. lx-100]|uniref:tRNA dihydrouridine synthase DusB n=1 Tax=Schaalia sp. lx-100 TaxID=2899081 RepID=UPI002F2B4D2D
MPENPVHVSGPTPAFEVGPLRVWSPVVLAPMAGVTDAPFRRLCREYGESGLPDRWFENHVPTPRIDAPSGLYVMEMVTSRAFVEGSARTFDMLRPDPAERVRSVQLYGVNPTVMAQAARLLVDQDLADHIDLNFGCPVPKVTRKGGGAALPWKKDLFTDLVTSVVRATESASVHRDVTVPVTIKMRIGIDEEHHTYMDAARIAEKAGVAAVALHARTQTQHYSGKARWEHIARLKDRLKIPVLGNGDVFSGADALAMMNDTGCDAVVVGRGCQGRPWIFRDLVRALHGLPELQGPTLRQVATIIEKHAQWVVEKENDEFRALREMRKHVGWYLRGFAIGGPIRGALNKVSSLGELHERLHALDLDQPFPKAAQGPRGRAGGEKTPHLPDGWLDSPYLTPAQKEQLHLAEDGADGG